jgi:hypothetical protein
MATTVKPADVDVDVDPEGQGPAVAGPTTRRRSWSLLARARQNLSFRSVWSELNCAMGDLGTYIPIVLSQALSRHLDLGTTLIFTGICNAITGLIYGVPMLVQPMKSIGSFADRPSALLLINRRLFCRSTVGSITCNREHDRAN